MFPLTNWHAIIIIIIIISTVAILAQAVLMLSRPSCPHRSTEVHSLEDACRWAGHYIAVACDQIGRDAALQELASQVTGMSTSSAFSGTGGPEVVMHVYHKAFEHFMGQTMTTADHLFAIEYDVEGQNELLMLPEPPACLFTDMTDCINPRVAKILQDSASRMYQEDLEHIFMQKAAVVDHMWCTKHCRRCPVKRAHHHSAGTPCIAWSPLGLRNGLSGSSALAYLSWVAQRRRVQEDTILHENVKEFPVELLMKNFSDIYVVGRETSLTVNASAFGQAYDRTRRLTWLQHKRTVVTSPTRCLQWPQLAKALERTCCMDWTVYFQGRPEETQDELVWASSRTRSHATTSRFPSSQFEAALTDTEARRLAEYRMVCPDGVVLLGQEPEHFAMHNHDNLLPCIIRSRGFVWSMRHGRWLTSNEMLAVHNFPVLPATRAFQAECSFVRSRKSYGLKERTRSTVIHQAGNGMSLAMVGAAMMWRILMPCHAQSSLLATSMPSTLVMISHHLGGHADGNLPRGQKRANEHDESSGQHVKAPGSRQHRLGLPGF